ncbi:hypothetical protein [Halorubrum gandharaense]
MAELVVVVPAEHAGDPVAVPGQDVLVDAPESGMDRNSRRIFDGRPTASLSPRHQ